MATASSTELHQPRLLFRYRSLAEPFGRSTAEDIILHSRMYWSSPADFNDPMDCNPNFVFGRSKRDQIAWARAATKRELPEAARNERREFQRRILNLGPARHRDLAIEGFAEWMRESAVCCFSTVCDSILMWSHYADHHRGIVFIFREIYDRELFFAFPVIYSDRRPSVDITTFAQEGANAFRDSVLSKASAWSYESEMRMIDYRVAPGIRRFPPRALQGVILGARISDDDREFVRGLIAASGRKIRCSTARLSDTEFILEFDKD